MNKFLLREMNKPILIVTFAIFLISLISIYSATHSQGLELKTSSFVFRQIVWMALALVFFFIVISVDYQRFIDWAYILYGASLCMLVLVMAIGYTRFGAQRWFGVGGFTLQPSEFTKITFILALSAYLGHKARFSYSIKDFAIALAIMLPAFIMIFLQPDLGTAATLLPVLLAMLLVRGTSIKHLITFISIGVLSVPLLWPLLKDYQRQRLLVFVNPNMDPLGAGYTVIQSKISIGSGMFFGKGWMAGTQNQLNFLPERHTDFIFSTIGEEWGFFGSSILILLYAILIYQGLKIAHNTTDSYGKLLATGIVTLLAFQVVVNIGMAMGFMPVVGLPLPLLSYGGSSLLTTMVSIGILLNIGMRRPRF